MTEDRRSGSSSAPAPPLDDEVVPYDPPSAELPADSGREAGTSEAGTQAQPAGGRGSTALEEPGRTGSVRDTLSRVSTSRPRYDPRPASASAARPAARRRARLAITRVDPWSVFVLSLLVSIFLGVVLLVAVLVLYGLLSSLGVIDSINSFAVDLQIIDAGSSVVSKAQVLGVTALLAAVDVVLLTVLATLAAFLYNVCASLTGGIEVALAERD